MVDMNCLDLKGIGIEKFMGNTDVKSFLQYYAKHDVCMVLYSYIPNNQTFMFITFNKKKSTSMQSYFIKCIYMYIFHPVLLF